MHPGVESVKSKIALAADMSLADAILLYQHVSPWVGVVKVGLSLYVAHGPEAVGAFQRLGANVFLDLKLHDIPNTVELAAKAAASLGVSYLTVHAAGGEDMVRAAVRGTDAGAKSSGRMAAKVLAVTVLTSMDDRGLNQIGIAATAAQQVERLAQLAVDSGVQGLVSSAREVAQLKATLPPGLVYCTPGIRPLGADQGDQLRIETPSHAIASGATLLVVGRAISNAADPKAAAQAIYREVEDSS
jgi:orotidine-5'-phosphate decarboxylase